jgi:hypothetical protein
MSSIEVRPFRRSDREQLTALVNSHAAAVVPGASVSVNTVMSQLEREPGEFIVDPWVIDRATLIADQRGRVVAAAHLLRYASGHEISESYRDLAEIGGFSIGRRLRTGPTRMRRETLSSQPALPCSTDGARRNSGPTARCPCPASMEFPSSGPTSALPMNRPVSYTRETQRLSTSPKCTICCTRGTLPYMESGYGAQLESTEPGYLLPLETRSRATSRWIR